MVNWQGGRDGEPREGLKFSDCGRRFQFCDAELRQQSASVVQRRTMLPFHPWALSGRPISAAHSDVPGPQRLSQPEDGTVAADNVTHYV